MEKTLVIDGFLPFRAKESRDIEAFLGVHRPTILRVALAILGRRDLAEDVAQEVLLRASQHWTALHAMQSPEGWLRVVTVRRAMTVLTRSPKAGPLPEIAVEADRTEALAVHQTLAKMDPNNRTILALAVGEQWSYEEIADALEIPIGTVGSRIHNAKKAFRLAWGDER
jgi:RNA polymerase sigma-70 factor (ECF subfamily)